MGSGKRACGSPFGRCGVTRVICNAPVCVAASRHGRLTRTSVKSSGRLRARQSVFIFRYVVNYQIDSLCGVACTGVVNSYVRCIPHGAQSSQIIAISIPLVNTTGRLVHGCLSRGHKALFPFVSRRGCGICVGTTFHGTKLAHVIAAVSRQAQRGIRIPVYSLTSSRVTHQAFVKGICGDIGSPTVIKTVSKRGSNDQTFTHCHSVSVSVGQSTIDILR